MQRHADLAHAPLFAPTVGRFYRGMMVEVPLQLWSLAKSASAKDIHDAFSSAYANEVLIEVASMEEAPATLDAELLKSTDHMKLFVLGNEAAQQVRLVAVLDNLGKGAAGAAVQNLNIMLGVLETSGLR
jgi:N-acetyl-gamma-glutamyl-phosphate reductase